MGAKQIAKLFSIFLFTEIVETTIVCVLFIGYHCMNWDNWNLVIKMLQLMINDAKKSHQKYKPEMQENIPQIKTLYFWSFVFSG